MGLFPIGTVARQTSVKVPTIRYYEQIGLLPEPERNEGNRRLYSDKDVRRLVFIRHARELGFEIEDIKELVKLAEEPQKSCAQVDRLARQHLKAIQSRITRLEALRLELEQMIKACAKGRIAHCRVIEVLSEADHQHPPFKGAIARRGA